MLALTRLVVCPDVPRNAASFLLSRSVKLIRKDGRFECLVTYADEWQGHKGQIYKACNWEYVGRTNPEAVYLDVEGNFRGRKRGPKTYRHGEMLEQGCTFEGKYSKHKYKLVL